MERSAMKDLVAWKEKAHRKPLLITGCRQYKPALAFKVSAKNVDDNRKGNTYEISLPLYMLWRLHTYLDQ